MLADDLDRTVKFEPIQSHRGNHMADITIDEFRDEVVAFLDANAPQKEADEKKFVWGEGEDDVALFEEIDREQEQVEMARGAKAWRAKRFDAGLGWITGPKEYGGRELPGAHERAYGQLEAQYDVPDHERSSASGSGMVAPTILAHAHRRCQGPLPAASCSGATSSAASCSASPAPAPTWPACRPRPSATATSGSSTARRCGPRARTTATSARSSAAPTPTCPSTRASPASSST